MSGIIIVVGLLLIGVGIYAVYEGWSGKGSVASDYLKVSGSSGLVIIGIGAIMVIIGAYV